MVHASLLLALSFAAVASASRISFSTLQDTEPRYVVSIPPAVSTNVLEDLGVEVEKVLQNGVKRAFVTEYLKSLLQTKGVDFQIVQVAEEAVVPAGYPNYEKIISTLADIASSNPSIAKIVDVRSIGGVPGLTYEGRTFPVIKISKDPSKELGLPNVHIVSSHHAREIVNPVIAIEAARRLVEGYSNNSTIRQIVDSQEIFISPLWNPDGYAYVFNSNNLWRKNRKPVASNTYGVDQNRNYDEGWSGSCPGSTTPSSETYRGVSPGSEEETKTMKSFSSSRNFAKVLDFHSYGREVLIGFNCQKLNAETTKFINNEGAVLSKLASYGTRVPSADGEHQEWILKHVTSYAFLVETSTDFQPVYRDAISEFERVWPLVFHLLNRKSDVSGYVLDAKTKNPVRGARIFVQGQDDVERFSGVLGRWDLWFSQAGSVDLIVSAPGYKNATVKAVLPRDGNLDIELVAA